MQCVAILSLYAANGWAAAIRTGVVREGFGDCARESSGGVSGDGEKLADAGVSIEGGGVFLADGRGVAHFLFADGDAARRALEAAKIRVVKASDVVLQRLRQGEVGQLGKLCRRMAAAGVNIEAQYSDHGAPSGAGGRQY